MSTPGRHSGVDPPPGQPTVDPAASGIPGNPGPVAYFLKMFPRLSETFIVNEIRELERRGVEIRLVSLMRPTGTVQTEDARRLAGTAFYLPDPTCDDGDPGGGGRRVFHDHMELLRRRPTTYLRTLVLAARRFSPTAWKRFFQAGSAARFCLDAGVRHIHAGFAHTPASVAFWTARLSGLTFSFAAHAKDIWLSEPKSLRRKMDAARFVYTCTEANAGYLRALGSATPVVVGYHGSDLHAFGPRPGKERQEGARLASTPAGAEPGGPPPDERSRPLIVAVGRLVPKKGFSDLIEAARILRDQRVPFELVFVGDGPLRTTLSRQASHLDLNGSVRFAGSVTPAEVRRNFTLADVAVLPSVVLPNGDRDGIPNVLVEAMAMGVPVVSTRISAIPELIRDGETGLLVEPHAPEALAAALRRTFEHPEEARRRAERAREDVRRRFDLRANSAVIAGLLARHCGPNRCLYVCADFGIPVRGHKGASAHIRQIASRLAETGIQVRVVSPNPGPEPPEGNRFDMPVVEVPPPAWLTRWIDRPHFRRFRPHIKELRRLVHNLDMARAVGRLLRADRPDFVLERYSLAAFATGQVCRRRGIPWLLEVNAPLSDEEAAYRGLRWARLTRALERMILKRADHCFVVSHNLRRWAIELGVSPERVSVLPNGVDGRRFSRGIDGTAHREAWGWNSGEVVVGFSGSLKPWHGVSLLLESFLQARRIRPELRLLFVGDGPEGKALRRRVRESGADDLVRFTGAVPQSEVPALLRAADILVAPYLEQDRFYFSPLKIMEYLAVGRPVIASRLGDIPDWIDDSCGRLVASGDIRELAERIDELAADAGLRGKMGSTASRRVAGNDWSDRAATVLARVEQIRSARWGQAAPSVIDPLHQPRVAYVLKMFPRFSETFVVNEILEVERQGIEVRVFSMKTPVGRPQAIADRVRAARSVVPRNPLRPSVCLAHLRCLRRDPRRYRNALLFALGRRDRRALDKFVQAGVIADTCLREGIGHVHAHFASGPARVAKFASMISGLPFSFTAHAKDLYWQGHHHKQSHKLKKRVKLARFVAAVSAENERFIQSLGFRVKEGRVRVIHIGLRMEEFPFRLPSSRPRSPRPVILGIGRLIEKKGFHILVEALGILRGRGVSFRCLLAGEGPQKDELEARIRALGLEGQVRLLGPIPLDRLRRRYYSRARVLAQPCVIAADGDRDGIPTVLLEAMALGVPVISTRVSGIPEAITDGENGFLTDPGDAALLADRIELLLKDAALADRMAAAGRDRVERQFNLVHNAGALRKLFLRSLAGWAPLSEVSEDDGSQAVAGSPPLAVLRDERCSPAGSPHQVSVAPMRLKDPVTSRAPS